MEWRFYDDSANLVKQNIDTMNARADLSLTDVRATIASLASFQPGTEGPNPHKFDLPPITIPSAVDPAPVSTLPFGTIEPWKDPEWHDLSAELGLDPSLTLMPGKFNPKTGIPTFREAPGPIDESGQPEHPVITAPHIPDPPTYQAPPEPTLINLSLSAKPTYVEPAFDGIRPYFKGTLPSDTWVWVEPQYTPRTMNEVVDRVQQMLAGGTGIPDVVQQALYDMARTRESWTALAAEQDAFDAWAGRGFGMPPGMLVAQVNAIREKASLAENALSRDILGKATAAEIENLRFAVTNGMELEKTLHAWFEVAVQRSFEVSKYHLEIEMKLCEIAITLFNAEQGQYRDDIAMWKQRIDAKLAVLSAWKVEIDGEIAKGQFNEQKVKLYLAACESARQNIVVFTETMKGVLAQADVNRSFLEGYRTDVGAWGEVLTARKTVFDAFDSENRGKTAQVGAYEAEARGFAETVRAAGVEADVKMKFVDAKVATLRASTEKYQATLQAERERVQADLGVIQATKEGFVADTGRYHVEIEGANQARAQEIQISEMRLRNNLSYNEIQLKEYDAALARQIHRVELMLEALKAAGQFGTTLAAGIMSAIHVQAGISGTGHVSDSYSYSDNVAHKGGDRL